MKKTLVALAVLAASGASFAQATLTGAYAFGYETQTTAGVKKGGIGTDTAAISVAASEDLGGGLKASAKVSLGGMNRDGAGTGEDATLSLAGGFGTISAGTVESAGNGTVGVASAGAPGYDLQGRVYSANANIDTLKYTTNEMSGFKFSVGYVDRGTTTGSGLNAGTEGAASAQPSWTVGAAYAAGAIAATADYSSWTRQSIGANDTRYRLAASYDLGVAKVGAGYSSATNTADVTTTETAFGVAAPLGALTVGAQYGTSKKSDSSKDSKGYTLGASYALSKRTSVGASYFSYDTLTANDNTGFRVLVGHSF
ncbi:MAG: hypothetical protein RL459_1449 [Pseudomonadota bacterium]|jgi:predicted porin